METAQAYVANRLSASLSSTDWGSLGAAFADPSTFTWQQGVTPFSHLGFVLAAILFYVVFCIWLRYRYS